MICLSAVSALAGGTIPLRIEPPQEIRAIVLRHGDDLRSVEVREGRIAAPEGLPLPWTVGLTRFEPTVYAAQDLAAGRPIAIRELGILRGAIANAASGKATLLLRNEEEGKTVANEVAIGERGGFELRLAAGLYEGAVVSKTVGTRIRSGIVIRPGQATDLGTMKGEPLVPISFRVVDAESEAPLAGAEAIWDPPPALNADAARSLFHELWSGRADRSGRVTIHSVGPLPIPVRWRVEAKGYVAGVTGGVLGSQQGGIPDVGMRRDAWVRVRVRVPERAPELAGAMLRLGNRDELDPAAFRETERKPLRPGETAFRVGSWGPKRLRVDAANGRPLLYTDFAVEGEDETIELDVEPVIVEGKITRSGRAVENVRVTLADPIDAKTILGTARSDEDGQYRLRAWQSGILFLYAIADPEIGRVHGVVSRQIDRGGASRVEADFELAGSGARIQVCDASSEAPLEAQVLVHLESGDGRVSRREEMTDASGRMTLDGEPDGTVRLVVRAKGYGAEEVRVALAEDPPETIVRLNPAGSLRGTVTDERGLPISGAWISGGYASEVAMDEDFRAVSDAGGRFLLDAAPPAGTLLYAVARGFALGLAAVDPAAECSIVLSRPGTGVALLRPDGAPPRKLYLVMAAPAGGRLVPLRVLDELARSNGMTPYQLHGTAEDGTLVLPEFLGPGRWDLVAAYRGGRPFNYQRLATIGTPTRETVVVAFPTKP